MVTRIILNIGLKTPKTVDYPQSASFFYSHSFLLPASLLIIHISYLIVFLGGVPRSGSGFPFQSFCSGQQKGFPLQSLTHHAITQTIHYQRSSVNNYSPKPYSIDSKELTHAQLILLYP